MTTILPNRPGGGPHKLGGTLRSPGSPAQSAHQSVGGNSTQIHFHPNHGIELLHEMKYKLRALVAHNFLRDSMVMEHSVLENPHCTESSEVDPNPFDQCLLCELVNNDKDHIVSTGEGEGSNDIP